VVCQQPLSHLHEWGDHRCECRTQSRPLTLVQLQCCCTSMSGSSRAASRWCHVVTKLPHMSMQREAPSATIAWIRSGSHRSSTCPEPTLTPKEPKVRGLHKSNCLTNFRQQWEEHAHETRVIADNPQWLPATRYYCTSAIRAPPAVLPYCHSDSSLSNCIPVHH
jgi:hypothetical protein